VVIPAYEAASTIGAAIRSVLEQDEPPVEILVVDDGSTDDLSGALEPFGAAVRMLRIDHGGESAAKNAGVGAARGDWVALLDADDRFLPGRLAALGALAAARPDLDLLTTDAYLELDGERVGRCYHDDFHFAVDDQRSAILDANFVFGHVMVRRDRFLAIGGFDPDIRYTADWECWVRLVLDGARFGLVDAPLSVYRMHETAMSASRAQMYQGRVDTLTKTARDPRLTSPERARIEHRIVEERARVDRERARAALVLGTPDARARSWAVARNADQPAAARGKALVGAVLPPVAAAPLRRRDRTSWVGVGDVRYPRRGT
jgi:glycosyltransferase involved in cell wall biosynthesis